MPATTPLPTVTTNKIKARTQSVRFSAVLREVREFRAYCCNIASSDIMGVTKQPVPIVTATPNPVCLGNAITVDFTGSYAPGSSITSRAVAWGDLTADADPAGVTETHTYSAIGEYTITATVTEGTGLTQSVDIEVNVIDCSELLLMTYIYAATDGNGVWYYKDGLWTERNTGLSATAKQVNFMAQHPATKHLNDTSHELLIATDDRVWRSFNGGREWAPFILPDPSNAEFADSPAAVIGDLIFDWVAYDPTDSTILYIRGTKSSVSRMWIYKSTDDGVSWTSRGVIAT